ncbi:MAG: hypothetical protein KJO08_09880 [Gammaproteobacteria bacterium]|nr:hypothetical protein [Gammaproteobacteria bacterium]NNJ84970.1 hypothetical protein [Gammaproteobacteria bacterium]
MMDKNNRYLRILIYAQHLSGVGHYVRTFEIARALASHHEVYWVEGGRPVPHAPCSALRIVELPRIQRDPDGGLCGVEPDGDIKARMDRRAALLLEAVDRIRPDAFLIEYFPFSKWELGGELLPAINAARAQGTKVLCSLRDVVRKTRFEVADNYSEKVIDLLNHHFDALFVHADPTLTRLGEHFPDVPGIKLPIHHTGLVSEKLEPSPGTAGDIAEITAGQPFVIVSAGGGAGGQRLMTRVIGAWQKPGFADGRLLVVCAGLGWPETLMKNLAAQCAGGNIVLLPFREDFLHWLAAADLSISQCGYNTAANLLETRTPAIVCPNMDMSDQPFRARRLAELGLVELFDPDDGADRLLDAIGRALSRGRSAHAIDLDGAAQTGKVIEGGVQIPTG